MAVKINNRILLTLALCLGFGSAVAQSSTTADLSVPEQLLGVPTSSLDLLIDESKTLDIISPGGVNYDSGTGDLIFDVLGPLFCFELMDNLTDRAVLLSLTDANGDPILEGFRLDNALQYRLATNQIALSVPSDGACFYEGTEGFGLSGNAPPTPLIDGDQIFSDRFLGDSDLQVEFIDVPQFVRPGETVSYAIEVRNLGNVTAGSVGFQELYPRNPTFYPDGQLIAGFYQCQTSGGADCADAIPGTFEPSIRGQNLSIPPGGEVRFNVSRAVFGSSIVGGTIDLYAGAIERNAFSAGNWDSSTATMIVIGEGQTIAASFENTVFPVANGSDQAQIRVTALDNNKNPTPDVLVQLSNSDGLSFTQSSGVTGADGSVLFFASTLGLAQAGAFLPEFTAPDIGSGGASTNVSVEFVAGSPTQISATTVVDNAVANDAAVNVIDVEILDAWNNPVPDAEVTVAIADTLNFASTTVSTGPTGIAQFSASSPNTGSFFPEFAQADIAGNASTTVTFTAGAPAKLLFAVQPSNVNESEVMTPPVVIHVLDAFDNLVVTDNTSSVTLQLRQNGSGQSFYPDETANGGIVTFSALTVDTAGTGYELRAFSNYPTITSQPFEVFPAP